MDKQRFQELAQSIVTSYHLVLPLIINSSPLSSTLVRPQPIGSKGLSSWSGVASFSPLASMLRNFGED